MAAAAPAASAAAPEAEGDRIPGPGDTIAGRYRIDGYLGRGGMGAVLSATHVVTGKPYAIKWVLPRGDARRIARERLLREARMAGRIDHPNVVHVVDVGEHEGSIFLVMELLRGESLKALIARGPLPVDEAIRLLMPVMRGVAAAHEVGIVHRDLKPDNILLTKTEATHAVRPTVLDFGISRGAEDGLPGDLTLTQTGVMLGTPLYMAPEQLAGKTGVDPRYDVYALGVILYELVTGSRPFEGETYALLVSAKLNQEPIPARDRVPDLDPRFEKVLLRAMARRPGSRWGSVQAFATALEPFSEGCTFADDDPYWRPVHRPSDVPRPHAPLLPPSQRRRRRVLRQVPALVAVLGTGLALGLWWNEARSARDPGASPGRRDMLIAPPRVVAPTADAGVAPATASEGEDNEDGDERTVRPRRPRARGRTGRLRVSDF
jgi:serine/threonine-protein kinase